MISPELSGLSSLLRVHLYTSWIWIKNSVGQGQLRVQEYYPCLLLGSCVQRAAGGFNLVQKVEPREGLHCSLRIFCTFEFLALSLGDLGTEIYGTGSNPGRGRNHKYPVQDSFTFPMSSGLQEVPWEEILWSNFCSQLGQCYWTLALSSVHGQRPE